MLRYQQQYTFFDQAKLNTAVRFINLSQVVLEKDLDAVLEEITKEVEKASPGVVVVDSFRTVVRKAQGGTTEVELQSFIQRLALLLTSWQATTFLVGNMSRVRFVTTRYSRSPMASFGFTRLRSEVPLCGNSRS